MAGARREHDSRRVLWYALACSFLVHAVLLPLLLWLAGLQVLLKPPQPPESEIMSSTSIRIERRSIPKPHSVASQRVAKAVPHRPQVRHVIAHYAPTAPPLPSESPEPQPQPSKVPKRTLQQQLDAEQAQYAKEVAQLNSADNPHSIATIAPATPAAKRISYFDESGHRDAFLSGHGYLEPVKSWEPDPGHTCYYVEYSFQYAQGGSEEGNVPWPICYPKMNDEFKKPPHDMDLPTPQPGFTTAQYLTPLLKYYYNRKTGTPPP